MANIAKQKYIKRKISAHSNERVTSRALGGTLTDWFGDLQEFYNHWITPSGGGGNLANRIPHRFSTAEHLLYDDYQVIGEV